MNYHLMSAILIFIKAVTSLENSILSGESLARSLRSINRIRKLPGASSNSDYSVQEQVLFNLLEGVRVS